MNPAKCQPKRQRALLPHVAAGKFVNVRTSHCLRPYSRKLRFMEPLRQRRVKSAMRAAAKQGGICHIWWHPHNFGTNLKENLAALNSILDEYDRLHKQYGMQSLTMAEVADTARNNTRPAPPKAPV